MRELAMPSFCHVRPIVRWLCIVAAACIVTEVGGATYAPNHFLGKCLDDKWVKETEIKLNISSTARDAQFRLDRPHLHAAIPTWRFKVADKRTKGKTPGNDIFTTKCTSTWFTFWGIDAQVDQKSGEVTNAGTADGALIVEFNGWASHQLSSLVYSIIAQEVLGYRVALYQSYDGANMGARMSSAPPGLCTPIHVNVEEWGRKYAAYVNETYKAGIHNYFGRSGLYTTEKFVEKGAAATPPFDADFWRDYAWNNDLISALNVDQLFSNAKHYPPKDSGCADDVMGCKDSCSKTDTCTAREKASGKCLVVALMVSSVDNGWAQATFANNKIPAYFCFLGFNGVQNYAVDMEAADKPVVFYHYEPDPFHFIHKDKFTRIFLPRATPEKVGLGTGLFGENGYGGKTDNPISVDFSTTTLSLYASTLVLDHAPAASLLSRMTLSEKDMNDLLETYVDITYNGETALEPEDPLFSAACAWVRENYETWRLWLDRLPLCSIFEHVVWSYHHCDDGKPREIHFSWKEPHPQDPTKPYVCDGGMAWLPAVIPTSKSCAWLEANPIVWLAWTFILPVCDANFYAFNVSQCDSRSKRTAQYYWLLPNPNDPTKSLECRAEGDAALPDPVEFACEFTPFESPLPQTVSTIAAVLVGVLTCMIVFVIKYRNEPIVKRSQYEFLIVMLVGGILMCGASVFYAGEPTYFLCGARPLVTSLGFTLVFGSLVVKSLRVYRVFMSGAMKRVIMTNRAMFKILGVFLGIDALILLAWFVADFPKPRLEPVELGALNGDIVHLHVCQSSSFIFTALLVFWKAIVLFMGLYVSFLIRNVSSDFQESIWIFASSLVVLFGSIIILPMAYLVELPADVFYAFLAFMLLSCTALVMGMMLVPKILRLKEKANESTTIESRSEPSNSGNMNDDSKISSIKVNGLRLGKKAQVSVTPVQDFNPVPKTKNKQKDANGPATPGAANESEEE